MCLRSLRRAGVRPPASAQAELFAGQVTESKAERKGKQRSIKNKAQYGFDIPAELIFTHYV